jgi:hypothetical protein
MLEGCSIVLTDAAWVISYEPVTENRLFVDASSRGPGELLAATSEVFQESCANDGANLATSTGLDVSVDLPISIEHQRSVFACFHIGHQLLQSYVQLIDARHVHRQ